MAGESLYLLSLKVDKLSRSVDELSNDIQALKGEEEEGRKLTKRIQREAVDVEQDMEYSLEWQARTSTEITDLRADIDRLVGEQGRQLEILSSFEQRHLDFAKALRWLLFDYYPRVHRVELPADFREDHPHLFLTDGSD